MIRREITVLSVKGFSRIQPKNMTILEQRTANELPYLTKALFGTQRLLDIGCGPAFTTILLAVELQLQMLYLMDGNEGERNVGYRTGMKPWYGIGSATKNAIAAQIPFEIVKPDSTLTFAVDAIVSLLSWGHHYPVSTYIDLAKRSLKAGDIMILDLRRGRGGLEEMITHGFVDHGVLYEKPKFERHIFRKCISNGK